MKYLALLLYIFIGMAAHAQDTIHRKPTSAIPGLFHDRLQQPLAIKLKFSAKDLRKNTNDSAYIPSYLSYRKDASVWDSLKIKLRARGNYRRNNCYYVPLKLKLDKPYIEGTMFEGNPKLKIVLPCLTERDNNDLVLKEYMAYKFFEVISPYHFKTRLAIIEFNEEKGSRIRKHNLKAIFIEDMDNVAERHQGRTVTRKVHPLQQDGLTSLQNSFFQFLIGNTDFSTKGQHNEKLLYTDNKYVSIPYDFDMSGLVNASYATISGLENIKASITRVTERVYKGYKRDDHLLQKVRLDYLAHKNEMFAVMDSLKEFFHSNGQFTEAKDFIADFFEIMESDKKFQLSIADRARTK